jgi:hypothetical protein
VLSIETVNLLSGLLDQMSMPVGHPEFEANALAVITARRELEAERNAIARATPPENAEPF